MVNIFDKIRNKMKNKHNSDRKLYKIFKLSDESFGNEEIFFEYLHSKVYGSEGIPPGILHECASELSPVVSRLF